MSEWRTFPDREALDEGLAMHLAGALRDDIAARDGASLALSGGSTPRGMFRRLSQYPLNWSQVYITLVDERWVDRDHPDSNERLLRENLLRNEAAAARLTGLKTAHAEAADAVTEVSASIAAMPRPFSAAVLGMGSDGHTASWFPQASNLADLLDEDDGVHVGATDPVTAPHRRMTLKLPTVLNSREVIIHITGSEKREILAAAREQGYPIAAVLDQSTTPVNIWWAP